MIVFDGALLDHNRTRGLVSMVDMLDGSPPGPVFGVAAKFNGGDKIHFHWHDYAQLVYALSGAMTVITEECFWMVPPRRAVWIPAMERHAFRISSALAMRTIYIHPEFQPSLGPCCVIQVSPLLAELTHRCIEFSDPYTMNSREGRIVGVLLDEIEAAPTTSISAPLPKDHRLRALARQIAANPGDNRTLEEWAQTAGASGRTLARLFRKDTGMSFAQWRQQVRLTRALQLLAAGKTVTEVAEETGYDSTSAFISMFCRNLGTTPGRYLHRDSDGS